MDKRKPAELRIMFLTKPRGAAGMLFRESHSETLSASGKVMITRYHLIFFLYSLFLN
jgi:hypothetical protein